MSIKGAIVSIRRSELHTVQDTVALWEVPVIAAVHDDGAVQIVKEIVIANRELPNVKEEMERLEARYKRARNDDGSQGDLVAHNVFGKHAAGLQTLKRAIQEAKVEEDSLV